MASLKTKYLSNYTSLIPQQDVRLILPALAFMVGSKIALTIPEKLYGLTGILQAGTFLFILGAYGAIRWTDKNNTVRLLIILASFIMVGVATTHVHTVLSRPEVLVEYSTHKTRTHITGTILSHQHTKNQWGKNECSAIVASTQISIDEKHYQYTTPRILGWETSKTSPITLETFNIPCDVVDGQKIDITGRLSPTYGTKQEAARIDGARAHITGDGARLAQYIAHVNTAIFMLISDLPPHASLIPAVALGDDSAVSDDISYAMQITNMTHLIAVSGGHISIIAGLIIAFIGRRYPPASAIIVILSIVALVVFVGAPASVIRAGAMSFLIFLALALRRSTHASVALAVAMISVSIINPWIALSYGFILSASATAGIILIGIPLSRFLNEAQWGRVENVPVIRRYKKVLAQGIAIPLAAQIACYPTLFLFTNEGSIWGVLANALVAPVVAPLTIFGLAASLTSPYNMHLASLLILPARICTWWIDTVVHTLSQWYGSAIPLWVACISTLALLAALILHTQPRLSVLFIFLALSPILIHTTEKTPIPHDWKIIQCDVGQGSAMLARRDNITIMVDVGPENNAAAQCLKQAHVTHINLLVLSHYHDDHIGGLSHVLNEATIDTVWLSPDKEPHENYRTVRTQLATHNVTSETVSTGYMLMKNNKPLVHVLSPHAKAHGDPNAHSIVVHIDTSGGVLVMGDADGTIQNTIAASAKPARSIIVAHHGSAHQTRALAEKTQPQYALISVGENTYGHPSQQALNTYKTAEIYDTRTCGTIAITDTDITSQCEKN